MAESIIKKTKLKRENGPSTFSQNNDIWVAPEDGFIMIRSNQGVAGVWFCYIYDGNSVVGTISGLQGTGGLSYATTIPVIKGRTYKLIMSGITSVGVYYYYYS